MNITISAYTSLSRSQYNKNLAIKFPIIFVQHIYNKILILLQEFKILRQLTLDVAFIT